jgi:hypothetical protein
LRIAVSQLVGAGCRAAGTLLTQIRHIPAGGRYCLGTAGSRTTFCADESRAFGGASDCAPA